MMDSSITSQIDKIIEQSKEIEELVYADNFSDVLAISQSRHKDIVNLFNQEISDSDLPVLTNMTNKILSIDNALKEHIQKEKSHVLDNIMSIKSHSKAKTKYKQIASIHK